MLETGELECLNDKLGQKEILYENVEFMSCIEDIFNNEKYLIQRNILLDTINYNLKLNNNIA